MKQKTDTARLSVLSNSLLVVLKFSAGLVTSSVSIISEAIHSLLDLLAAIIAYISVKISDNPPDHKHPYGHGKFENISGVIEALLIFVAAIWIIYEAVLKMMHRTEVESFGVGMVVMAISAVVNLFVSRRLFKVAKQTDSVALKADGLHLSLDVFTSLGVAVGLALIWITGLHILDAIIAIIVALIILKESYDLLKTAFYPLVDVRLSEEEIRIIDGSISKYLRKGMTFHQLRTRKSGPYRYVDLHLEVPAELSVKESHDLCDAIEAEIKHRLNSTEVSIHVEPLPPVPVDSSAS